MSDPQPPTGFGAENGADEGEGSDLLGIGLFLYFVALIVIVAALLLVPALL